MAKRVGTWIYYDKKGNQLSKIQHNQVVRQNNGFTLFVAFDKTFKGLDTEIFEDVTANEMGLKAFIRKPSESEYSNIIYADAYQSKLVKFEKITPNEMTYGLVDGEEYIVYELRFESSATDEYGSININIQTRVLEDVYKDNREEGSNVPDNISLGVINVYVQPTYNTEREPIGEVESILNRLDERVEKVDGKSFNQHLTTSGDGVITIEGNVDTSKAKFRNPEDVDNPDMASTKGYVDKLAKTVVRDLKKTEQISTLGKTYVTKVVNGEEIDVEIPLPEDKIKEEISDRIALANHVSSIVSAEKPTKDSLTVGIRYQTMKDQTNYIEEVRIPLPESLATEEEVAEIFEDRLSKKNIIKDVRESKKDLQIDFVDNNNNIKTVKINADSLVSERELDIYSEDVVCCASVVNAPDEPAVLVEHAKSADLAEMAYKDSEGNLITDTYMPLNGKQGVEEITVDCKTAFNKKLKLKDGLMFKNGEYFVLFDEDNGRLCFEYHLDNENSSMKFITYNIETGAISYEINGVEGVKEFNIDEEHEKVIYAYSQTRLNKIDIDSLTTSISDEQNRATSVENSLREDLTIEQNRALAAEEVLDNNLSEEQNRALAAEEVLSNNLSEERNRAIGVENSLREDLTTKEQELQNYIDSINDKPVYVIIKFSGFVNNIVCHTLNGPVNNVLLYESNSENVYFCCFNTNILESTINIIKFSPLNGAPTIATPTAEIVNIIKVGDL